MSLKHILVHVDESERSEVRLGLAIEVAQKNGAVLTGFFAENDPQVMTVAALDPEAVLAPRAARMETWFRERVGSAGLQADWAEAMTASDAALTREAIAAAQSSDLAIFGQHDPDRPEIRVPAELVEQVVLHSGRPVLIVPHTGRYQTVGRRVMVAWNWGREASRALNDAIPLMREAQQVILVAINIEMRGKARETAPFGRIRRHLEAHGINIEVDRMSVEDISAMDMLLARLSDEAIDLLVMGAHGHYGFPYTHRGGSTRHILRQMTVPVLMSH